MSAKVSIADIEKAPAETGEELVRRLRKAADVKTEAVASSGWTEHKTSFVGVRAFVDPTLLVEAATFIESHLRSLAAEEGEIETTRALLGELVLGRSRQTAHRSELLTAIANAADVIDKLLSDRAALKSLAMTREPTEAMLNAARDWSHIKYGKPIGNDAANGCWKVMFDAMPKDKSLVAERHAELKSTSSPAAPLDDHPCTLETVIAQLKHHRETHTEWAGWFERHPDDPRAAKEFGDAAFHRKVEDQYTQMIEFLESLAISLRKVEERLGEKNLENANLKALMEHWDKKFDEAYVAANDRALTAEAQAAACVEALGEIVRIVNEEGHLGRCRAAAEYALSNLPPNASAILKSLAELRLDAKLLRCSSEGLVGKERHWMKDTADHCEQSADFIARHRETAKDMHVAILERHDRTQRKAILVLKGQSLDFDQGTATRRWLRSHLRDGWHLVEFLECERALPLEGS